MNKWMTPRPKQVAIFATLASTVYLVMVLGTLSYLQTISGMVPFDLRPSGYSPEMASELINALGANGRTAYLKFQLPLDLLYPPLFALTLAGLSRWIGNMTNANKMVAIAVAASWASAGLDYIENAGITAMLLSWPELPHALVHFTSLATVTKSLATSLAVTLLVILIIRRFVRRSQARPIQQ